MNNMNKFGPRFCMISLLAAMLFSAIGAPICALSGEKPDANSKQQNEHNLVNFTVSLSKDFNAPKAKFVLVTMGESMKGSGGNGGKVLEAQLAIDGTSGKYPEFKGAVATTYSNPMAQGGSGNGHYGGNAKIYMEVGEVMGKAMAEGIKNSDEK